MNHIATREQACKLNILIVEDNMVNQRVLIGMLNHIGDFDIDVAENGREGLDKYLASSGSYDLVLMDCEMPIMGGVDASRAIREYEQHNSLYTTPIIVIAAHVTDANKQKCINAGVDDFVSKPVAFETVYDLMLRFCPDQVLIQDSN